MRTMVAIRLLAAFATGAMLAAIAGAFSVASFPDDGAAIVALAWGRVTLIDIYLAFVFGWLWIAWRERSVVRSAAWLVAIAITGSLALFGYLLGASLRASTPLELLLGPRQRSSVGQPPGDGAEREPGRSAHPDGGTERRGDRGASTI